MSETTTFVGNVTADPVLQVTDAGIPYLHFSLAFTPSSINAEGRKIPGPPIYLKVIVWRQWAENLASTLTKGMLVIAVGERHSREYKTRENETRVETYLKPRHIGPDTRFAIAHVTKVEKRQPAPAANHVEPEQPKAPVAPQQLDQSAPLLGWPVAEIGKVVLDPSVAIGGVNDGN